MYKIYKLVDCDGLIYIGKTNQILYKRLAMHRYDKNRGKGWSSSKLNLDKNKCEMILLEECDKSIVPLREQYWMDQYPNRVNKNNAHENKLQWFKKHNQYIKSWGGYNSLLNIDINLFNI